MTQAPKQGRLPTGPISGFPSAIGAGTLSGHASEAKPQALPGPAVGP